MEGVSVDTELIPVTGQWHIRRHVIRTDYPVECAEAAFAVARDKPGNRLCDRIRTACTAQERSAMASGAFGTSAIYGLVGYDEAVVIHPECSTNLMEPRTELPMLKCVLQPGIHTLVCAVYAATDAEAPANIPEEVLQYAQ